MWRLAVLAALSLIACGKPEIRPPTRSCVTQLRFAPASVDGGVALLGEWNGFNAEALTAGSDGVYTWSKTLEARSYGYRFKVGGGEQLDDQNPYRRFVNSEQYSRLDVPDCNAPLLSITSFSAAGNGTLQVSAQAYRPATLRNLATPTGTLDGMSVAPQFDAQTGKLTLSVTELAQGKHTVTLSLADTSGAKAPDLYLPFWVETTPFDWRDAVLYFPFTDRFRDGDASNDNPVAMVAAPANYQGGDFAGIQRSIDDGYFDRLGVRAIWLSPLDLNPNTAWPGSQSQQYTGYHGYWPSRPVALADRWGTPQDLSSLVKAAHAHGIRVLADLVLNHVHSEHPYYAQHKEDGWFHQSGACVCGDPGCDWDAHAIDCWFTSYLPDYDWRNAQMADQVVADAMRWLQLADLDGFRIDAVKHFEHLGSRHIAGRVHEITANTQTPYYLVGETFTGNDDPSRALISSFIDRNELDGQFDFPLYWPLVDTFAKGGPFTALDATIAADEQAYPASALMSPFLGNQDLPRFISIAANQIGADASAQAWNNPPPASVTDASAFSRAKQAFAFLLSQPGVPLLYYGDEIGLPGAGDPDNRRLMRFDSALSAQEADLLAFVQTAGTARKGSEALRRGDRHTLLVTADQYVYQRESDNDEAVVAFNRSAAASQLQVTFKGRLSAPAQFKEVFSGQTAMLGGGSATLNLPAGAIQLWVKN